MYKAYFDASIRQSKNNSTIAFVVYNPSGEKIVEISKTSSHYDNNYAEWLALNLLLKTLRRLQIDEVEIYGDNKSIIDIANGLTKNLRSRELHRIIWKYGVKFKKIVFNWIERKENKEAHKLSRNHSNVSNISTSANNKKKKHKNKNDKYIIHPEEFNFNFKYKETRRKCLTI